MKGVWGQAFFENALVQLVLFVGMIYMGYPLLMQPPHPANMKEHKVRIGQIIAFFIFSASYGFCQEANRRKAKMDRMHSPSSDLLASEAEEKKEAKSD